MRRRLAKSPLQQRRRLLILRHPRFLITLRLHIRLHTRFALARLSFRFIFGFQPFISDFVIRFSDFQCFFGQFHALFRIFLPKPDRRRLQQPVHHPQILRDRLAIQLRAQATPGSISAPPTRNTPPSPDLEPWILDFGLSFLPPRTNPHSSAPASMKAVRLDDPLPDCL